MGKECKDVVLQIGDYVNDKLAKEQKIRVMEHLLICTECRDSVEALTVLKAAARKEEDEFSISDTEKKWRVRMILSGKSKRKTQKKCFVKKIFELLSIR